MASGNGAALKVSPSAARLSANEHARGPGYRIYGGDSQELMGQFEDATFDLVFADPPYFLSNGGYTCQSGKRAPVAKGEWDTSRGLEDDFAFTRAWLAACQRVLKPTGTLWVSGTQHVIFTVGYAMQSLGFKLLNTVTWYKPNASPNLSCRYFTHSTELLIWASPKKTPKLEHRFNYQAMKAENGGKQMRDVWSLPKAGEEEVDDQGEGRLWNQLTVRPSEKSMGRHPTQKPVSLLERVIEASTQEDDLVLDPFQGSGTTGVAAMRLGRRYVGIDKDPEYLELARRRLDAELDSAKTVKSARR
jgi:site-specific DNA-methyltransferase (adenine-specific)